MLASLQCVGYPENQYKIPNGRANGQATGHAGGPAAFRVAFVAAGEQWTETLCKADQDGDGQSNGLELGDPCCTWTPGTTPAFTDDISIPGLANSMTSRVMPECPIATEAASGSEAASTSSAASSQPPPSPSSPPPIGGCNAGCIAGIAVGGLVVLVVLIALAVKLTLRAARKPRADMAANKVMTDQTGVVVTKADAVGANASAPDVKPTPTAAERL